ncbi:MAG: hypothetical protein KDA44_21610 [Planctomycetales bacterium]|nr:hypothetical protein [Planctomycetales bacterium]
MKPIVIQFKLIAIVAACALFARVAWAETPVRSAGVIPADDEQLQQAFERAGRVPGPDAPSMTEGFSRPADDEAFRAQLERLSREGGQSLSPADVEQMLQIRQSLLVDRPGDAPLPSATVTDQNPPQPMAPNPWPRLSDWGQPPSADPPPADSMPPGNGPMAIPRNDPRPQYWVTPQPVDAHAREHHCVAALRSTAQQLDNAANQLEQCELYDQADALRETAQRLRIDARHLAGQPHEPDDEHPVPFGFRDPPAPHFDHPWSRPDEETARYELQNDAPTESAESLPARESPAAPYLAEPDSSSEPGARH